MLTAPSWQLQKPINAIIFDCDGTLSAIEGIDELAKHNHVGAAVKFLTAEAMGKTGINPDLYRERLELVQPLQSQVEQLGDVYYANLVPDAAAVINYFQRVNKTIYIISAGLLPAVRRFGSLLNIPDSNIFAVDITFNSTGKYLNFDHNSPFTKRDGKCRIVSELKTANGRVAHIGDGMNDFIAHDISTRFVGYGGIFYRKNIAAECGFYIKGKSLAALLPLLLTGNEIEALLPDERQLYNNGLEYIMNGLVEINPAADKHHDY